MQPGSLGTSSAELAAMTPETLSLQNLGFVRGIANRTFDRNDVDFDDLVSEGMLGLVQASRRFKAHGAASFSTFAYYRIRGAMLDANRKSNKWQRGRLPVVAGRYTTTLEERPQTPLEKVLEKEGGELLKAAVEKLPARQQFLIKEHYFAGKSLVSIARALGISKSRLSHVHRETLVSLNQQLQRRDQKTLSPRE